MATESGIDPTVQPSGTGCADCEEDGTWWFHLRRCAECGHIGCCDTSPNQHATKHWQATGHPVIRSFEPGEDWFWSFEANDFGAGPALAPPLSHPEDQPIPAPSNLVPPDWESQLNT